MLRLALPLLLGLALTSTARAESLRPPVDDAVWRVIEGSGGEAGSEWPTSVGFGAAIGGSLALAVPSGVATFMLIWALPSFALANSGAALFVTGVTFALLAPVVGAILGLEGLLARRSGRWWAGALAAPVVAVLCALAGAAVSTIPGAGFTGFALGAFGGAAVTALASQYLAFGLPVPD